MKKKIIKMFKDGQWVKWDGSDVQQLIIEEQMTLREIKMHLPEEYKKLIRELNKIHK